MKLLLTLKYNWTHKLNMNDMSFRILVSKAEALGTPCDCLVTLSPAVHISNLLLLPFLMVKKPERGCIQLVGFNREMIGSGPKWKLFI